MTGDHGASHTGALNLTKLQKKVANTWTRHSCFNKQLSRVTSEKRNGKGRKRTRKRKMTCIFMTLLITVRMPFCHASCRIHEILTR